MIYYMIYFIKVYLHWVTPGPCWLHPLSQRHGRAHRNKLFQHSFGGEFFGRLSRGFFLKNNFLRVFFVKKKILREVFYFRKKNISRGIFYMEYERPIKKNFIFVGRWYQCRPSTILFVLPIHSSFFPFPENPVANNKNKSQTWWCMKTHHTSGLSRNIIRYILALRAASPLNRISVKRCVSWKLLDPS